MTLVDSTPDAQLLARARPGTLWPWSNPGSLADLVGVAADLLTSLWAAPSAPYVLPALENVYPQNERVARQDAVWEQRRRGQWVAIDPLPMTGDPAAEVAAFASYHPAELILPIAEALARAIGLDPRRALRWAAIWTVHEVTQAWRDDQQHAGAPRRLSDAQRSAHHLTAP